MCAYACVRVRDANVPACDWSAGAVRAGRRERAGPRGTDEGSAVTWARTGSEREAGPRNQVSCRGWFSLLSLKLLLGVGFPLSRISYRMLSSLVKVGRNYPGVRSNISFNKMFGDLVRKTY